MSELEPASSAEAAARTDRRRPGRPAHISPTLVPLLRGSTEPPSAEDEPQFGDADQLRGARGLAMSVALSAPLWAAAGLMARWIFR